MIDARALLLPRHVGDHQHDDVEVERMAHVDGGDEVADVRRVERAAEQADAAGARQALVAAVSDRHGGGRRSGQRHGGAVYGWRVAHGVPQIRPS